jgi:Arc/MetJ family transcription regulator
MRTTLDIPEDLLKEAQAVADVKTKTTTVIIALQEFIARRKIESLRRLRGKIDLEVDLKEMRRDRLAK